MTGVKWIPIKMHFRFTRRFAPMIVESEGTTIIEYAIVLPIFLILWLGIIELSLIMYAASVLEGATNVAAREGKTGYFPNGQGRQSYIYGLLGQQAAGLLDPNQITITTTAYSNFTEVGQGGGTPGLGNPGDIVLYTASYPWPMIFLLQGLLSDGQGAFSLTSTTIVKNEPYNSP